MTTGRGLPDWAASDLADACELPDSVLKGPYDLVISNSVIEHVGGHERRQRFVQIQPQGADAAHELPRICAFAVLQAQRQ